MTVTTLLQLRSSAGVPFDGSQIGIGTKIHNKVSIDSNGGAFVLNGGSIEVLRNKALDDLQTFTLEADITADKVAGERRNIAEAATPPVALFIDKEGALVGSVHTKAGWVSLNTEKTSIPASKFTQVQMTRDEKGRTALWIDNKKVVEKDIPGPLVKVGEAGFFVGSGADGKRYPFDGKIHRFDIREGLSSPTEMQKLKAEALTISQAFISKTKLQNVVVNLIPDESKARLQPIKDILLSAGVENLSDLDTLKITQPVTMTPGQVIVAPRKSAVPVNIDWSHIAKQFLGAKDFKVRQEMLASSLTNRNSIQVLTKLSTADIKAATKDVQVPIRTVPGGIDLKSNTTQVLRTNGADLSRTLESRLPAAVKASSPVVRSTLNPKLLRDIVIQDKAGLQIRDSALTDKLTALDPSQWPSSGTTTATFMMLTTIPVNSAVIIAHRLDLTNTELKVEPNVSKLYIIAEEVICGANARITWLRPGGSTPARADDPDLNGRGYNGVHTKQNSRDGLNGEHGRSGITGIAGARGRDAPELEMWVKTLTAIPQVDLNGETGQVGGRGQRGGKGGRGANGANGLRAWFFGWHCTRRAGHGGHGGNGGDGGRGGQGGDGGAGANITIGVLQGTLASTVTSKSFKIKNQGGSKAQGGDGGAGGAGGSGGSAGIGETCKDAQHGRPGAQGQPGARGPQGHQAGMDGEISLFEFTESAWNELLTRPWITQLVPSDVFPGDSLTLRGSRFVETDRVVLGSTTLAPTVNADESISIAVPVNTPGGETPVYVRRADGTESNRLMLGVKPRLEMLPGSLPPAADIAVRGRAFLNGASVLINGESVPTTFSSATSLTFTMPGTGGTGSSGGSVSVQVANPDGRVSNARVATRPRILEIPFRYGTHNLSFGNFSDGVPDWSTFEDTFGAAEVWHELLDPLFGHPILTAAYFGFYKHFLKGTANGGLATGFCTSLAALVADRFWQGETNQTTLTKQPLHKWLTAVHGRLLSRESLIHFHDQGRQGLARVELTAREIEATFLRGCDRDNAPLLFFIPSGAVWNAGYFDELSSSHCVMPYRFVYPEGHSGAVLSPDQRTTISSLDGVHMYVWDCNDPTSTDCRLEFRVVDGELHFDYVRGNRSPQFRSTDGITLGMMTNGKYLLSDHDLPFSGPFGLTRFVVDFLLSPADIQVTDGLGLRTGNFGGQIVSEIPGSLPAYLMPGMYLLPADTALTRKVVGNGTGNYTYNTILPDGSSLVLEGVATRPGEEDTIAINADGTQIRFVPGRSKEFALTLSHKVEGQARAISVEGMAAAPGEELDITISPDLSMVRLGNRGAARPVSVKAFSLQGADATPTLKNFNAVNIQQNHDLVVAVADWKTLEMDVASLSFD